MVYIICVIWMLAQLRYIMKLISITFFLLVAISDQVFCQTDLDVNEMNRRSNTFYVEVGGPTLFYSVNYEHGFMLKKGRNKINARIGFSKFFETVTAIPIGASIDFGKIDNFFQINVNRTFDIKKDMKSNTSIGIAYVRRPIIQGFYFHSSLMFLYFDNDQPYWDRTFKSLIWGGIGGGFSF